MSKSLFEFNDYKTYLKHQIHQFRAIRGYQSHLAAAARCQRSFFSQVVNGSMDFTRDQAAELTSFWNLNEDEAEYFLTLVDLARASSERLKILIRSRLEKIKEGRLSISRRLGRGTVNSPEAQQMYYSSWYWSAIHILTAIPGYGKPQLLADRLKLPLEVVLNALEELSRFDLVRREKDTWVIGNRDIHLHAGNPMTEVNHTNWRKRAIDDIPRKDKNSVHYTSVFAVSRSDAERMRQMMLDAIVAWRAIIPASAEEDAYCLSCDFFAF